MIVELKSLSLWSIYLTFFVILAELVLALYRGWVV